MKKTRATLALLLAAAATAVGLSLSTPAFAACGDTQGSWVPALTASTWDAELYLYDGPVDETAVVVLTGAGQVAATTVVLPVSGVQVLTGTWGYAAGTFTWSGTDTLDNSYRLTMAATADSCGGLGGVHAASGSVVQQDVGTVGVVYMTRVL